MAGEAHGNDVAEALMAVLILMGDGRPDRRDVTADSCCKGGRVSGHSG